MKTLSIIIVNYNVCHFLEQTLTSVYKAKQDLSVEVFVVDNNSVDGSVEMVKEKFPEVELIDNKENLGFSKANNQAIRRSKGEFILLLNPDTVIEEDTLVKIVQFMQEHPEAGGLGVKMLDGKGNFLPESKRGLPSPWVAFYKIFGLSALFPKSKKFGHYHLGYLDKDKTHQVEVLSGAFMLLRKSTLDTIGLLDEDYFMYGEDIDLSYRILKHGKKNYYYPETRIIHYKGESTKKTSINYVFIFYKAMIIFAQKHFTSKNAGIFSFLIHIAIYLRAAMAIVNRVFLATYLPLFDFIAISTPLAILEFWSPISSNAFPRNLLFLSTVWLLSLWINGAYSNTVKIYHILKAMLLGSIVIAAASYVLEPVTYTKSYVVVGSVASLLFLIGCRAVLHFSNWNRIKWMGNTNKTTILIGSYDECKRIDDLLKDTSYPLNILGYITSGLKKDVKGKYLGSINQLTKIVQMYGIEEIIFCSKDLSANTIIEWMTKIDNTAIDFKIVPEESNVIIGSNSKNKRGDFYTLNINLNILKEENLRNKRVLDVAFSLSLMVLYPMIFWIYEQPKQLWKNITSVMSGDCSWVGYSDHGALNLPRIKPGILHPLTGIKERLQLKEDHIIEVNLKYARDYSLFKDIHII
ncbi:MAG: glycosyltransferase family 2 protein, partial [Cytophagaceae bacterium]|nr:glycosyltransferase family 2 protein [Cytophagaceae bacterium]